MKQNQATPSPDGNKRTVLPPLKLNLSPAPPAIHFKPTPSSDHTRKAAIFVVHGMGQQIPFETLDESAKELLRASGATHATNIGVRTVQAGKKLLQRVEFDIHDKNNQKIEVHLYEGYWAPITEGKVSLPDVVSFLWYAAINGLKKIVQKRDTSFFRWIFGRSVKFPIPKKTFLYLIIAFLTLLALGIIGVLSTIILALYLLPMPLANGWPSADLLRKLTVDGGIFAGSTLIFGAILWCAQRFRPSRQASQLPGFWKPLNAAFWVLFYIEIIITIVIGARMAYFSVHDFFFIRKTILADPLRQGSRNAIWLVWGGLFFAFRQIRRFLIQYLGDVVAYVASYRLDRFVKIRRRIKRLVHDVLYAIYAQNDDEGNPVYHHVGLIGHSLGSVIAYDALNALLNEDALNENALKVAERTRVLATFGSPLDKIAYVFSLAGQHTSDTREALAAAVQPLIVSYAKYRQFHWVNVYSERDIIGGSIDFYDTHFPAGADYRQELDSEQIPPALRAKFQKEGFGLLDSTTTVYAITSNGVKHWEIHDKEAGSFTIRDEAGELNVYPQRQIKNIIDPDALIPLVAHTELWKTGKVFDEFYEAFY